MYWCTFIIPALERLRLEDRELEVSLSLGDHPVSKTNKRRKSKG
jgi:hypothetical protein